MKKLIFSIFLSVFACNLFAETLTWEYIFTYIDRKFPEVKQLEVERYEEEFINDSILIDVRNVREYEVSHIKNAIHSQSTEKIRNHFLLSKKKYMVLYCSVGVRSSKMASKLNRLGFDNVYNLKGSIFHWANSGRLVYNKDGITNIVHPYNKTWGVLLDNKYHSQLSR